jgi:hypothetical protein
MYLKGQVQQIEELNIQGETRKFCHAVMRITKDFQPRTDSCNGKNGKVIGMGVEVLGRWAEYFEDLLNVEGNEDIESPVYMAVEPEDIIPNMEEVAEAVNQLKNGRVPGEGQLTAELLKYGGLEYITHLHSLISKIWEREVMPEEWKTGLICRILKKGDKLNCCNYRRITLLNVTYKIFSIILQRRTNNSAEEILGDYHCRFHPGGSTTDQLLVMRQSMEKLYEYGINLHMLFIDF